MGWVHLVPQPTYTYADWAIRACPLTIVDRVTRPRGDRYVGNINSEVGFQWHGGAL